jgi:MYXO-CTERM domain-containing protein
VLLVRVLVAVALAVSGWIHLDLAASFDAMGRTVTLGALFRAQGGVAFAAAAWLLLARRSALPVLAALLVGLASLAAIVLSFYVRLPAIGPFPEIYEPVWYGEKSASAVTAGLAAAGAAALLAMRRRRGLP